MTFTETSLLVKTTSRNTYLRNLFISRHSKHSQVKGKESKVTDRITHVSYTLTHSVFTMFSWDTQGRSYSTCFVVEEIARQCDCTTCPRPLCTLWSQNSTSFDSSPGPLPLTSLVLWALCKGHQGCMKIRQESKEDGDFRELPRLLWVSLLNRSLSCSAQGSPFPRH